MDKELRPQEQQPTEPVTEEPTATRTMETDWINAHIRSIEDTREEVRRATEPGISDWDYFMQADETHSMYYGILNLKELKDKYKELEGLRLEDEEGYGVEVRREIIDSVHKYRIEYSKHLKEELEFKRNNFRRETQQRLDEIAKQKEEINENIGRWRKRLDNITNGAKEGTTLDGQPGSSALVKLIRGGNEQIKELGKEETLLGSLLRGLEQGYGLEKSEPGKPEPGKPEPGKPKPGKTQQQILKEIEDRIAMIDVQLEDDEYTLEPEEREALLKEKGELEEKLAKEKAKTALLPKKSLLQKIGGFLNIKEGAKNVGRLFKKVGDKITELIARAKSKNEQKRISKEEDRRAEEAVQEMQGYDVNDFMKKIKTNVKPKVQNAQRTKIGDNQQER